MAMDHILPSTQGHLCTVNLSLHIVHTSKPLPLILYDYKFLFKNYTCKIQHHCNMQVLLLYDIMILFGYTGVSIATNKVLYLHGDV